MLILTLEKKNRSFRLVIGANSDTDTLSLNLKCETVSIKYSPVALLVRHLPTRDELCLKDKMATFMILQQNSHLISASRIRPNHAASWITGTAIQAKKVASEEPC